MGYTSPESWADIYCKGMSFPDFDIPTVIP